MAQIGKNTEKALALLRAGKPVALPTETVYGLGANALDALAVAKIFSVKQRPAFDPLIIHLASAQNLQHYAELPNPALFEKLYRAFCPGPLSFILPKKSTIPDIVTAGHSQVAMRFPAHPLLQELLSRLPFPLAAPSANLFGRVSPTTAQHVEEQLGQAIEYILDGGSCRVGIESTIVDLSGSAPRVLRLGGIALEDLESVLNQRIEEIHTSSSNPTAPGMLSAHYSPGVPLRFGESTEGLEAQALKRTGALRFRNSLPTLSTAQQRILSPTGNLPEAAAALFAALRSFSPRDYDLILAENFPEEGLGRAINDRLHRAAAKS